MFYPIYIADFTLLSKNAIGFLILGAINALNLSHSDNDFMYCKRSLVGEKFFTERLFYC